MSDWQNEITSVYDDATGDTSSRMNSEVSEALLCALIPQNAAKLIRWGSSQPNVFWPYEHGALFIKWLQFMQSSCKTP